MTMIETTLGISALAPGEPTLENAPAAKCGTVLSRDQLFRVDTAIKEF